MYKRKSKEQWMTLVKDYETSGLNITAWCRAKGIRKSSFYQYIKKIDKRTQPSEQKWGLITIPKNIGTSLISLRVGAITLDINSGFDKETLADVLNVVMKQC